MDWRKVQEALDKEGYWLRLDSPFHIGDLWWAGFTPHNTTGWNGRPDFIGSGLSPDEAVFDAAIEVVRNLEKGAKERLAKYLGL